MCASNRLDEGGFSIISISSNNVSSSFCTTAASSSFLIISVIKLEESRITNFAACYSCCCRFISCFLIWLPYQKYWFLDPFTSFLKLIAVYWSGINGLQFIFQLDRKKIWRQSSLLCPSSVFLLKPEAMLCSSVFRHQNFRTDDITMPFLLPYTMAMIKTISWVSLVSINIYNDAWKIRVCWR